MRARFNSRLTVVLAALALALFVPSVSSATTIPIANPGFETGTFAGWTAVPGAGGVFFGVDGSPHSGSFAAYFGETSVGVYDTISQVLPTTAGQLVNVTFWLMNSGGPSNNFQALWNGVVMTNVLNASAFGYTQFTFSALAVGPSTLAFRAYQLPAFFFLDDISADAVPEPATLVLVGGGLAFVARRYRRRA